MPVILLAKRTGGPEGFIIARLLLPAGVLTDKLAIDLLTHFDEAARVDRLCRERLAIRGLPSEGLTVTEAEAAFLPVLPEMVKDIDELANLATDEDAEVFAYDKGDWFRVFIDGTLHRVREMKLSSLIPGT